jgi:hypothetical protein
MNFSRSSGTRPGPRGRQRMALVAAVAALALSAAMFWAGTLIHDEANSSTTNVIEPVPTVAITRQRLIDSLDLTATVVAPPGFSVAPLPPSLPADATDLITGLPVGRGGTVSDGTVLAEVAGTPIVALAGDIPMYRSFSYGLAGSDIAQFQRAIAALGYPVTDPAGYYGLSTAAAAAEMFRARGYALPVEKVHLKPADAKVTRRTPVATVPASAVVFIPHLPGYVGRLTAKVGEHLGTRLMEVASGSPRVVAAVDASQASTVASGMYAIVDASDKRFAAHVAAVSSGESSRAKSGNEGTRGIANVQSAVIAFDGHHHLPPVGSPVSVTVVRIQTPGEVWAVPYSAVQTTSQGASYVNLANPDGVVRVPVTPGLTVGGMVAIQRPNGSGFALGARATVEGE